jgi:hypothetical protein
MLKKNTYYRQESSWNKPKTKMCMKNSEGYSQ